MKKYIRTLYVKEHYEPGQREALRAKLNADGFYVLTGADDSLIVYAIERRQYFEERVMKAFVSIFKRILE